MNPTRTRDILRASVQQYGEGLLTPSRSDLVTAAAAMAIDIAAFTIAWLSGDLPHSPLIVCFYIAFGSIFLAWRHQFPVQVFALMLLHQLVFVVFAIGITDNSYETSLGETYTAMAHTYAPWIGVIVALAAVASDTDARWSITAAFVGFVSWAVTIVLHGIGTVPNIFLVLAGVFISSWLVGRFAGRSRRRIHALQKSQEDAAKAVSTERALIAAELHDIVSHAVTVMTLHAAGGRRIFDKDPERAAEALGVIEAAGTQAMEELRRLLEALRAGNFQAELPRPVAGIQEAEYLLPPLREAGIEVELLTVGETRPLAPSVSHTAYRIIQESLTNVAKHAGAGSKVDILLRWTAGALNLEIRNDEGHSSGTSRHTPGYGLIGLSERVSIVGGTLSYGPNSGGFQVQATLPCAQGELTPKPAPS